MCCYTAVSYTAVDTPVVGERDFVKYPHTHRTQQENTCFTCYASWE